jgi:hypothetical protein
MKYLIICILLIPGTSWAWGKRGHQIVGETAARLVSAESGAGWLKDRGFDFGFYANVPDFIWKRPKTYEMERNQHFMDLEHFDKAVKSKPEVANPFLLTRQDFDAKFPEVKQESGRAFWRVREMFGMLSQITKQLKELKEPTGKARQDLQEKWLVIAGTMGHYVGDLSQPLHVTENYDGQMTDQKGIHSYFEEEAVEELYPAISAAVAKRAQKAWPEFKKKNEDKAVVQLLEQLSRNSYKEIKNLLAMDKATKRDPDRKYADKMAPLIEARLTEGALTLAEIYRRHIGWTFDGNRFYFFNGEPEYIVPGAPTK